MATETTFTHNEDSQSKSTERGRLVVLAGPSAVGKSTVVARVRQALPSLYFSVSATTRAARPGEIHGQDYYFISREEFQELIDNNELLEWADIHGGLQRSGTPVAPVRQALDEGRPVLVEVDLAGARQIRQSMPEALHVFLAPPSWEELVSRLEGRATESRDVIERRLATAREELDAQDEFDRVIVNDNLDEAVRALLDCWLSTADSD